MNEIHLRFDTSDDINFKYLLEYLSGKIPESSTIIDIGAFMGGYSLAISSYFPKSKIIAFEPVSSSFQNLLKNISRNECQNIYPYQLAITDKPGEVVISNKLTTGNHILTHEEKLFDFERIPSINLDTFITQHQIEKIHFIKCDVEGHEMAVLNGAKSLFSMHKPILYIEIQKEWTKRYGNLPEEIISSLLLLGYKCYLVDNNSIIEIKDFDKAISESENFLFMVD